MNNNKGLDFERVANLLPFSRLDLGIPKQICQTYASRQLPSAILENISRIKALNPGWEYNFYDDQDISDFIAEHCQWARPYFCRINASYGAARADLFRYLLMYYKGGVYLDIKSSMSLPLDSVLEDNDCLVLSHWDDQPEGRFHGWGNHPEVTPLFDNGELQQWHIIAAPRHPYLRRVIERVCLNISNYVADCGVGRLGVLRTTGPIAYTQAIHLAIQEQGERFRLASSEEDLGLIYSIFDGLRQHQVVLFGNHYSRLQEPVCLDWSKF